MSVDATRWVWNKSTSKAGDRLVLLAIADYADERGRCWASVKNIARKSGYSTSHTKNLIKNLERLGELRVELKANKVKHGSTNYYHLVQFRVDEKVEYNETTEYRPIEEKQSDTPVKVSIKSKRGQHVKRGNTSDPLGGNTSNGVGGNTSDPKLQSELQSNYISPADADTPTDAPDDLGVQLTATINGIPDSSYTVDELAAMYNVSTDVIWHNVVELAKANTIDLDSATKTAYPLGKKPKAPESVDDFSKIDWSMPFNDHESVKQAIEEHWNIHGGEASALASMLTYRPNAKYSEYTEDLKQANGGERLTSLDVKNFSEHWKATHDDGVELPRKASIVQSHLIGWIKAGKTSAAASLSQVDRMKAQLGL